MPGTSAADPAGWWRCLAVAADRTPQWFAVVWSPRHPDGARVELLVEAAVRDVGADAVCTARYDEHGAVARLEVGARVAGTAPPLWFVEVRESAAAPPAVNLVAFTGHAVAAGQLRDDAAGAASEEQLGAVRWYPASGEVDQVYVQPGRRRQGVASALIAAAATLSYARGWPRLWGDGQRTEHGEALRNASPWRHRGAELTHVAPPMTPGDLR